MERGAEALNEVRRDRLIRTRGVNKGVSPFRPGEDGKERGAVSSRGVVSHARIVGAVLAVVLAAPFCARRKVEVSLYDIHIVGEGSDAMWSPDGKNVAFMNRRAAPDPPAPGAWADRTQLLVAEVEGKHESRKLTPGLDITDFVWSPDSRSIAFVTDKRPVNRPHGVCPEEFAHGGELGVVAADGSGSVSVLTSGEYVLEVIWSPNSRELLGVVMQYHPAVDSMRRHGFFKGKTDSLELRVFSLADGTSRTVHAPYAWWGRSLDRILWLKDGNIGLLEANDSAKPYQWDFIDDQGHRNPKVTGSEMLLHTTWHDSGPATCWAMRANGAETLRLRVPHGRRRYDYSQPTWSDKAHRFAVSVDGRVFVSDLRGDSFHELVDSADFRAWLPDGKWLYCNRPSADWYSPGRYFIVSADGRRRGDVPRAVVFAPVGNHVLYTERGAIYVARLRIR